MENFKTVPEIPKEKFQFAKKSDLEHDKKLETKPVGYWRDAFRRFCKNKGSVVAGIIIILLLLFALITPLCTPFSVDYIDTTYSYMLPNAGWSLDFWDGCASVEVNEQDYLYYLAMGRESGHNAIKNQKATKTSDGRHYKIRRDSVHEKGAVYKSVTDEIYLKIQKYQNETGRQVIYPTVDPAKRPAASQDAADANYYFETRTVSGKTQAALDKDGNFVLAYKTHAKGEARPDNYDSLRIAGDGENGAEYEYAIPNDLGWEIRINYYEYYIYHHSCELKDGIKSPKFLFGTTSEGQDILTCLASGARFSFLFAIAVALVNMIFGALYGAIEGYYGGKTDLVMERISDILSAVPFMIVITLLKMHMGGASNIIILFIAFFLTGWIGMAGTVRMQFYRFKNQEYVLAARTLGAKDGRLMWKHIFPNSLGTIVTNYALVIPSMIYSETSLSYLGIINLSSGNLTSVGTLLANGQSYLMSYPHIIAFPSVFLALLMLSFNLFGNGLRDAFNPSLRGSEG